MRDRDRQVAHRTVISSVDAEQRVNLHEMRRDRVTTDSKLKKGFKNPKFAPITCSSGHNPILYGHLD